MADGSKVSIQIISDLHLESPEAWENFSIIPTAPILALVGDTGQVQDPRLFNFLILQLQSFRLVLFLFGNHEPYGMNLSTAKARFRGFEASINQSPRPGCGRLVFLDKTRVDLTSSVTVLGCTLYSQILASQSAAINAKVKDYRHIQDWTVQAHNAEHADDLAWLNTQIAAIASSEPERRVAVLTHYPPTTEPRTKDPKHGDSEIWSGFMTDLSREMCWSGRNVVLWVFGHTHFCCDFWDRDTRKRVLANQRGYCGKIVRGFDGEKVVSV